MKNEVEKIKFLVDGADAKATAHRAKIVDLETALSNSAETTSLQRHAWEEKHVNAMRTIAGKELST